MKFQNCDYILDEKDRFWVVHGNGKSLYCSLVFVPDKTGDRYNKILRKQYRKNIVKNQSIYQLKKVQIKRVFKPREFFLENYEKLPKFWRKIPDALMSVGINKKDIGIFGSFLIGFDVVKDVDFVVYGKRSLNILLNKIWEVRELCNAHKITNEHLIYQLKKYSSFYSEKNDFEKILSYNWAGLQFSKGVLSTIRFVCSPDENLENIELESGEERVFQGFVLNGLGSNFVPRIGYIKSGGGIIRVLTYFWMFNSCFKEGDIVLVKGIYNKQKNTLYLTSKKHWMKILN